MTNTNMRLIGAAAAMLAGLGAAGATMGGQASATDGPLSCAIETSRSGGMIAIESVAESDRSVTGSYSFTVRGGGTNIRQGGEFEAGAGETVTLGEVTLSGGSYDLKLEVSAGGRTVECSRKL